jgi:hypothetical protein
MTGAQFGEDESLLLTPEELPLYYSKMQELHYHGVYTEEDVGEDLSGGHILEDEELILQYSRAIALRLLKDRT